MKPIFKNHIHQIKPYEPGKPIKEVQREAGIRNAIKLASNENPLGPSRKALRAMRKALLDAHLYPEGSCYYLLKRLSQELNVSEAQIICGNGSNEIIELIGRGFLSEGDEVISSETSFLVYPILTQACGAVYREVPMKDFAYDLEGILNAITEKTKVIFIANPNNPTGTYATVEKVKEFIGKAPKHIVICFDEAYLDFVEARDFPKMLPIVEQNSNVIVLRTFSKAYGLAGLRIGYAIASSEMIDYFHKIRQPFNVNAIAQAGAIGALDDKLFLWRIKHIVSKGRRLFYKRLKKLKLEYVPSQANFVLINVGCDGRLLSEELMKKGMIIRSMQAYGLSTWIRVTIGRRSHNALFFRLLRECLKK